MGGAGRGGNQKIFLPCRYICLFLFLCTLYADRLRRRADAHGRPLSRGEFSLISAKLWAIRSRQNVVQNGSPFPQRVTDMRVQGTRPHYPSVGAPTTATATVAGAVASPPSYPRLILPSGVPSPGRTSTGLLFIVSLHDWFWTNSPAVIVFLSLSLFTFFALVKFLLALDFLFFDSPTVIALCRRFRTCTGYHHHHPPPLTLLFACASLSLTSTLASTSFVREVFNTWICIWKVRTRA